MSDRTFKSDEELLALLADAEQRVPRGLYRHSGNGKDYLVTGYGIQRYSGEPCVIYEAQYGPRFTFVRTLTEWCMPREGGSSRFKKL